MKGQGSLFPDLPAPAPKPLRFKPARHPIWTENKAKLIERYLYYFVLITKHGAYIDGFAAPQANDKPESWAAKLVLESRPAFLRDFWLCDIDAVGIRRLEDLVASQPKIRNRKIEIVPGDFNKNVAHILASSNIDENTASFCLLDQRTFECEWRTLEVLAKHKKRQHKIELFYFLASGWLDRAMDAVKKNEAVVEKWWGQKDWKSLKGMRSRERVNLFCKRFRDELGYAHAYPWEIFSREVGGRVMYHMIHATDHAEAPKIMNRAYLNATKEREAIKRLQRDLVELWGKTS
jgi:three-Cys-motif partner protein